MDDGKSHLRASGQILNHDSIREKPSTKSRKSSFTLILSSLSLLRDYNITSAWATSRSSAFSDAFNRFPGLLIINAAWIGSFRRYSWTISGRQCGGARTLHRSLSPAYRSFQNFPARSSSKEPLGNKSSSIRAIDKRSTFDAYVPRSFPRETIRK